MECQFVTGGAGFVGSCCVLQTRSRGVHVVNLDKLTNASNLEKLFSQAQDKEQIFLRGDIVNAELWRICGKTIGLTPS